LKAESHEHQNLWLFCLCPANLTGSIFQPGGNSYENSHNLLFVLIFALSAASTAQAQAFRINNFTITPDIVDIRDGVPQPITITANISTTYNLPTARYGISFIFSDGTTHLSRFHFKRFLLVQTTKHIRE
jgi:hypothetical protein